MHKITEKLSENNIRKIPFLFPLRSALFRFRVRVLTTRSTLRLCMIFLLYCTTISFLLMGFILMRDKNALQKGISKSVVRLHVIANSDSEKDQFLKLRVRDKIIGTLQDSLKEVQTEKEAEKMIRAKLPRIQAEATNTLRSLGSSDTVMTVLKSREFPKKTYGDLTFPAGTYRALCVEIGNASGHNWWCVLFPSLCFVDETTATVPEKSKEKLKKNLTRKEYEMLQEKPEPRSLIWDTLFGAG